MPTVINTNLASLFAQNSLSNAQNNLAQSVQRLSSGLRINSAKDDAAGLSISQNMQSQINGTNQSIRNLSDATNLLQTADSSLSTVQDMLLRLKQLATQGYDGSLSTSQKLNIVQEMKDLNNEINATAARTAFNGINLLSSGSSVDLNNSDIKAGTALANTSVTINDTGLGLYAASGVGASGGAGTNGVSTGLADAALGLAAGVDNTGTLATRINLVLDPAKRQQAVGSYTLSSNGSNLTMTGTYNGQAQSQTVTIADAIGNTTGGAAANTSQTLNFDDFGVQITLNSTRASGDTITGTTLATQLASTNYKTLTVAGKGGEVTDVRLSGVAPGTYSLSYNETGTVGTASNLSLPATIASGESASVSYGTVTFTGGATGVTAATGTLTMNSSGNFTGYTVVSAGSGYKAGDVLGVAARQEVTKYTFATPATGAGTFTIGGRTVTVANLTTAAAVATAFVTGTTANGATVGGASDGTYTFSAGANAGELLVTKVTAGAATDMSSLATAGSMTAVASVETQGMNAVTGIVVGKDIGGTLGGAKTLTMSGTVNGLATTQSLAVSANDALETQTFNFSSFGVQFDVKSYQAQSETDIGTTLATLNGLGGTTNFGNPGEIVVSQGNNSALKFQSGPNSDAFIQVDTINIQTSTSGTYAGTASEMTTLGTRIAQSGVGNLGSLGINDTIDTWQTAFKNAAAAVDNALEYISTKRATYGSQMNRLSYVSSNLQAQSTNLQNSRSAIIDTDFAAETAKLTKGQIMQQAATAMLAQANQMPNVILSLLK
jgi:flagellin